MNRIAFFGLIPLTTTGCLPELPQPPDVEPVWCEEDGDLAFVEASNNVVRIMATFGESAFCIDGALGGLIDESFCSGTLHLEGYTESFDDTPPGFWMGIMGALSPTWVNDDPESGTYSQGHRVCMWPDGAYQVGVQLYDAPVGKLRGRDMAIVLTVEGEAIPGGVVADCDLSEVADQHLEPKALMDGTLPDCEVAIEFADPTYREIAWPP